MSEHLTVAGFPARAVACRFGDVAVDVLVVDELETLVDREALLREPVIREPPYWAHLWVGSRALARRMVASQRKFTTALDIGCGVGLAGLVAARLGARTTLIDRYAEPLHFVRASARQSGLAVDVVQTDILQPGLRGTFDLCLAADVTYDPTLQRVIAAFLAKHLAPHGVAWCAESVRTFDRGFHAACRDCGLETSETHLVEDDDGTRVTVRLTEARWRANGP